MLRAEALISDSLAGLGIGGMVSKDVELNVRYDIDFSSTRYTNQMVSARVKVLF